MFGVSWLVMIFVICDFFSNAFLYSAKSRIKGTLEIYHAFVNEPRETAEPNSNTGDWEHVENVSMTGAAQAAVSMRMNMQYWFY